jgi:hypothetical protein
MDHGRQNRGDSLGRDWAAWTAARAAQRVSKTFREGITKKETPRFAAGVKNKTGYVGRADLLTREK